MNKIVSNHRVRERNMHTFKENICVNRSIVSTTLRMLNRYEILIQIRYSTRNSSSSFFSVGGGGGALVLATSASVSNSYTNRIRNFNPKWGKLISDKD